MTTLYRLSNSGLNLARTTGFRADSKMLRPASSCRGASLAKRRTSNSASQSAKTLRRQKHLPRYLSIVTQSANLRSVWSAPLRTARPPSMRRQWAPHPALLSVCCTSIVCFGNFVELQAFPEAVHGFQKFAICRNTGLRRVRCPRLPLQKTDPATSPQAHPARSDEAT